MVNEEKLLLQLKRQKYGAIDTAIEIYTPYLGTVLYNMAGNSLPKEDMEEIISDVFVVLWKNAKNVDLTKGTLRSYIAKTAKNFALKKLSAKREVCSIDEVEHIEHTDEMNDNSQLWQTVMKLGEPDNEIFVRFYLYDQSLKTIASDMDLNISTVKTRLSRGKKKLKKMLAEAML